MLTTSAVTFAMTFATDTAECSNKSDEYDTCVVLLVIVCLCFELFNQALTIDLFTRETWEFETSKLRSYFFVLTPLQSDKNPSQNRFLRSLGNLDPSNVVWTLPDMKR